MAVSVLKFDDILITINQLSSQRDQTTFEDTIKEVQKECDFLQLKSIDLAYLKPICLILRSDMPWITDSGFYQLTTKAIDGIQPMITPPQRVSPESAVLSWMIMRNWSQYKDVSSSVRRYITLSIRSGFIYWTPNHWDISLEQDDKDTDVYLPLALIQEHFYAERETYFERDIPITEVEDQIVNYFERQGLELNLIDAHHRMIMDGLRYMWWIDDLLAGEMTTVYDL